VIAVQGNEGAGLVVADVEMGDLAGRGVMLDFNHKVSLGNPE